jgi:hypothetical protein
VPEPELRKRKYRVVPKRRRPRVDPEPTRQEMIAEAAYYRSLGRGPFDCDPGRDWIEAEREIDALLGRDLRP